MLGATGNGDASGCSRLGDAQGRGHSSHGFGERVASPGWRIQELPPRGVVFGGIFQQLSLCPVFLQLLNNLGASQIICSTARLAMRAVVTRWGDNSLS